MASADALRRAPGAATGFLFVRAVRKLLRRFDPVLWEGDSAASRRYLPEAAEISALLDDLGDEPEEAVIGDICTRSLKLTDAFQTGNIPIDQVRRATAWAHHVPHGRARVLILENAEGMLESSRNALLKLLEEPPSAVYVVLTTGRKGAIIQTIQSRLRPYRFRDRSPEEQKEVLDRVFREGSTEYATLRDYFLAWRDLNPHGLRTLAHRFLDLLAERDHSGADLATLLSEVFETGKASEALAVFAEELLLDLHARLLAEELALPVLERWAALINEDILYARLYNPNPSMVLESLFHRMREATSGGLFPSATVSGALAGARRRVP
jgi:DNA polymerase-3 subunit gamma/tau